MFFFNLNNQHFIVRIFRKLFEKSFPSSSFPKTWRKTGGVSSFGIGGTNAHTIVEEARPGLGVVRKISPKIGTFSWCTEHYRGEWRLFWVIQWLMMLACVLQQDRQQGGVHLACGPIGVYVKWQNLAIVCGTRGGAWIGMSYILIFSSCDKLFSIPTEKKSGQGTKNICWGWTKALTLMEQKATHGYCKLLFMNRIQRKQLKISTQQRKDAKNPA